MKIKQFLNTIDGMATNTKRCYEQTLWQVHSFAAGDEPTEQEILNFLKQYPPSSLQRHKAAIKAYLEYQGKDWPFTRRQFMQSHQRIPQYIKPDVIPQILKVAESKDDYMFVWTLFQLGCRINELMEITKDDIKAEGVLLHVKGGFERLNRITADFSKELSAYVKGKKGKIFPQAYTYYYKRLKYLGAKVGEPGITPHMLRHSRAVDLLNKGMALPYVQQFLGHASINTTAIYTQITGGELGEHLERVEANGA